MSQTIQNLHFLEILRQNTNRQSTTTMNTYQNLFTHKQNCNCQIQNLTTNQINPYNMYQTRHQQEHDIWEGFDDVALGNIDAEMQ